MILHLPFMHAEPNAPVIRVISPARKAKQVVPGSDCDATPLPPLLVIRPWCQACDERIMSGEPIRFRGRKLCPSCFLDAQRSERFPVKPRESKRLACEIQNCLPLVTTYTKGA